MALTLTTVFFFVLLLTQNIGCNTVCRCGKKSDLDTGDTSKSDLLKFGVKTAAVAGAAVLATPLVLTAAGFGAAGIGAGTLAAATHSTWFGGAVSGITGAVFSTLQSIGAAGLGAAGKAAIVTTAGAAVKLQEGSNDKSCDCSSEG